MSLGMEEVTAVSSKGGQSSPPSLQLPSPAGCSPASPWAAQKLQCTLNLLKVLFNPKLRCGSAGNKAGIFSGRWHPCSPCTGSCNELKITLERSSAAVRAQGRARCSTLLSSHTLEKLIKGGWNLKSEKFHCQSSSSVFLLLLL